MLEKTPKTQVIHFATAAVHLVGKNILRVVA